MDRFIPLIVLLPQLGLTDLEWSQKRVTRLVRDGTIQPTEYSVSSHRIFKRGKPRKEYALSRLGAYLFAMAVRTTQADEWRRLQAERLNALMVANASNALPAAPAAPASLEALAARVEQLEARLAPVEARVEDIEAKIEARVPEQLALPGVGASKLIEGPSARETRLVKLQRLIETLGELERNVNGARAGQGLRAREVVQLLRANDPRVEALREAVEALAGDANLTNGQLGFMLREARRIPELGLRLTTDREGVARWFVASNATH